MKTYELANALTTLSKLLKGMPNVELRDLSPENLARPSGVSDEHAEAVIGLHTLVTLSKIDKKQWLSLISEHNFPIDIRLRDGSRDIIGKLFGYLEDNPAAQQKLKRAAERYSPGASKELNRALAMLLGESK